MSETLLQVGALVFSTGALVWFIARISPRLTDLTVGLTKVSVKFSDKVDAVDLKVEAALRELSGQLTQLKTLVTNLDMGLDVSARPPGLKRAIVHAKDPIRGRWGGKSETDEWIARAEASHLLTQPGYFQVRIGVVSRTGQSFSGPVIINLDPQRFLKHQLTVLPSGQKALYPFSTQELFTIGIYIQQDGTELEVYPNLAAPHAEKD